jgi:hypothetical protein
MIVIGIQKWVLITYTWCNCVCVKKKYWHAVKADVIVIGIQQGALMHVVEIIEIIRCSVTNTN